MRRVVVSLLVLVAAIGHSTAVSAQAEVGSVLLIMDASGSMNRVDSSGTRLIDGAKDALREIVLRMPSDANVGLRVYGHRTPNDDPVAGCADTELVVPVGPIDREVLNAAIDSFDASGFTPIGLSLQQAAEDLAATGPGTIILVSDGVDTCAPPDPCEVAEQLATEGFATQIHTVGLLLNDQAAVNQLQCIADAGNGTFLQVDSIDQFFEQLYGLVTEALEGPANPGLLVRGALSRELAPVVEWVDFDPNLLQTIGDVGTIRAGETQWFAFDVTHDLVQNGQLYVDASIDWQPDAGPDEYLEVEIYNEQGESVGLPHEVLGIVVEFPQRLYLARAADYIVSYSAPQAAVSTGPRSFLPAWEPNADGFALTRARFYDAGLNGGLYEMWKQMEGDPPLPAGRYYAAVTWSSDRAATSRLGIDAVVYSGEGEGFNDGRIVPQGQVLDLAATTVVEGVVLDLVDWDGLPVGGPMGPPLRSIEVWAPFEAEFGRTYDIALAESEKLVVILMSNPSAADGGRLSLELVEDESGRSIDGAEIETPFLGEHENRAWEAPATGTYSLTATLRLDAPSNDAAAILSIFVFAADGTKAGLPASVFDALMEGLAAVATSQ